MSGSEPEARSAELRQKLAELEARFRIEVQKRGFDPAQVANMALPGPLARLFTDCAALKAELKALEDPTGEP